MAKKKTFTAEELSKAMDDAYATGFRHAIENKKPPASLPDLYGQMQIITLAKNIADNGRRINDQLLKRHEESVQKHMKEWVKDADKALDEVLAAAEHSKKHHVKQKN